MRSVRYSLVTFSVLIGLTMTTAVCAQPQEHEISHEAKSLSLQLTGSGYQCDRNTNRGCPFDASSRPARERFVANCEELAPRLTGLLPQIQTNPIRDQWETATRQYETMRDKTPQHWKLLPSVSHGHCDLQHKADPVHRQTCQITPKLDYAQQRDATSDRYVIVPQPARQIRPQRNYVTRDRYVISPQHVQASRPRRDRVMRYDRYGGRAERVAKLGGKLVQPRRSSAPVQFKRNPAGNRRLASRVNDRKQNHINRPQSSNHKPMSKKSTHAFRSRRLIENDLKKTLSSRGLRGGDMVKFKQLVRVIED